MSNPVPKQLTPFTAETSQDNNRKRWAEGAEERTTRRIEQLVKNAPPLTQSQRAKLQALLSRQGA